MVIMLYDLFHVLRLVRKCFVPLKDEVCFGLEFIIINGYAIGHFEFVICIMNG